MPDDPYMTVDEFAALPGDAHHAVWAVAGRHRQGEGLIDTIPAGGILRYHREQVRALLAGLPAASCWHCRKPIVLCGSVSSHFGCSSGHGWIHSDPEQWGHSCEPRSGAPYARPEARRG